LFPGRTKKTEFNIIKNHSYEYIDNQGNKSILKGDSVIKLRDGSLTTIYHCLKKGILQDRITPLLEGNDSNNSISAKDITNDNSETPGTVNVCINCGDL